MSTGPYSTSESYMVKDEGSKGKGTKATYVRSFGNEPNQVSQFDVAKKGAVVIKNSTGKGVRRVKDRDVTIVLVREGAASGAGAGSKGRTTRKARKNRRNTRRNIRRN